MFCILFILWLLYLNAVSHFPGKRLIIIQHRDTGWVLLDPRDGPLCVVDVHWHAWGEPDTLSGVAQVYLPWRFFHPDDPRRQESWFWLTRCLPNWLSHSALVCNSLHCSSNTSTINLAAWAFLITDTTCFVVPAVKGVPAPLARSDHCCGSLSPLRVAAFCSCSTSQGCLLFLFANTIHSHGMSKVNILSRTYCKTWVHWHVPFFMPFM